MATLKQEFERSQRAKFHVLAAILGFIAGIVSAFFFWPDTTLAYAVAQLGSHDLATPFEGRAFKGLPFSAWNWVDASRRDDMVAAGIKPQFADALIAKSAGKRFLFYPMNGHAYLPSAEGWLIAFDPKYGVYTSLASAPNGGSDVDLKPYSISDTGIALPRDIFISLTTLDGDGNWSYYLGNGDGGRVAQSIFDPLVAIKAGGAP